jgi:hypothetical protein
MAAAVASYSHDHFHSLPDLNSARDNFLKLNGPKLVEDVFKDFFIANGMDRTFEYPGDDFEGTCEITMFSANINLKPKDVRQSSTELAPTTNLSPTQHPKGLMGIDTAWFFSPPLRKRGCRCTCDNRTASHGHGAHVITQSA